MQSDSIAKFSSIINFDEVLTLNKILSKYDFEYTNVECIRSAFKVTTDKGVFCLKKLGRGHKRALKSYYIIEHLNSKGFHNALKFYPARDGTIFIRNKKSTYYLTYWIDGREANFNVLNDILKSSEFMADFHLAAKDILSEEKIKIRSNYSKTPKDLRSKIKDMERIKKHIEAKIEKDLFDFMYYDNVDDFIEEAKEIVDEMKQLDTEAYLDAMEEEKYICHNSFYYQNILVDRNNELHIIDLESCVFDIPVNDLGKFIRRIITKSRYAWDFDICRRIIESYESKRHLSQLEFHLLYLMIIFPHKFWKVGRKKYIKEKNWADIKFERKLRRILELNAYKNDFADCFRSFYGLDETTHCSN